jgi:dTDP-glucose 4,6-dehydratase
MYWRCYKPEHKSYPHYGAKGIEICSEWLGKEGRANFYYWAKANGGEDKSLSLDRIDSNGPYSPENCRFVDLKTQARNKKNNIKISTPYDGEMGLLDAIDKYSKYVKAPTATIRTRIREGWDGWTALITPTMEQFSSKNANPKKLLVLGGLGYFGSMFVKYWSAKYPKYQIVIVDAFTYAGKLTNISDDFSLVDNHYISEKYPNVLVYRGNIEDFEPLESICRTLTNVFYVVNFAAETHVDNSLQNAYPFVRTNVLGVHRVLEAVKDYNLQLIHISTDEVLDHSEGCRVKEDSAKLAPRNPYAGTKAAAEMLCESYRTNFGLNLSIIRPCNLYGPSGQNPEKFLPKTISRLLEGKKAILYGSGEEERDWLFVEDACEALDLILFKNKKHKTYHIAPNNEISNKETLKKVLDVLGISWEDGVELVENRLGHDPLYRINSSRIRKLGWAPKTSFEEGIRKTVEYFKCKNEQKS